MKFTWGSMRLTFSVSNSCGSLTNFLSLSPRTHKEDVYNIYLIQQWIDLTIEFSLNESGHIPSSGKWKIYFMFTFWNRVLVRWKLCIHRPQVLFRCRKKLHTISHRTSGREREVPGAAFWPLGADTEYLGRTSSPDLVFTQFKELIIEPAAARRLYISEHAGLHLRGS